MHRVLRRLRAAAASSNGGTASATTMRTLAALGLAASALFLALTIVTLTGDGDGDGEGGEGKGAEVLGATEGPAGDLESASTDGGSFFVYAEDPRDNVAGSATVIVRGEGEVMLTVTGTPEGDRAVISARVQNDTADHIVFEDGLTVVVEITRGGVPWRTVEPSDRSVTELAPGETATVSTEVALPGHGEYELTGEVLFARR